MSAHAAGSQAVSFSKGLILAILADRQELSLRELVLCFMSCKAFRELLHGRGFCIGTAWLCAYLESGRSPTEILARLGSAMCSITYEGPLSRVDQVASFLTRHESVLYRWAWAQLLYQEPDGSMLCEGVKKMLWMLNSRLIKELHKSSGCDPGLCTLKGHSGEVSCVAWSPNGKQVASGSWDNTITIWDVDTGKESTGPMSAKGHTKNNPECTCNHRAGRYQCEYEANPECPARGHSGTVLSVAWSPDGKLVASGGDKTIRIWDVATGKEAMGPLKGHLLPVSSVAWSPDSKLVASGGWDETIRIWDVATGQEAMGPLKGHSDNPECTCVHGWGAWLGAQLNPECPVKGHSDRVTSVAWSPDGKQIASGSADSTLRIWDVATGKVAMGPLKHSMTVRSVAWSTDGKMVASGSNDSTTRIWDVATGKEAMGPLMGIKASWQNLDPHTTEFRAKVKRSDPNRTGQYIVTFLGDMVYVYMTTSDGEKPDEEEPLACFRSPASVSAVSCTGTSVVVGCQDGQKCPYLGAQLLAPWRWLEYVNVEALSSA